MNEQKKEREREKNDVKINCYDKMYLFDIRFDECDLFANIVEIFRRQEANVRCDIV